MLTLTKFFINPFDETFASKNSKVFYSRRLTIPNFIWSLITMYPNISFVENSHSSKCSFTPKGGRSCRFIKHGSSHLLNCVVHSFHYTILLRSSGSRELSFYSMLFTKTKKNSSDMNSPPQSDLRHLIFRFDSFSTKALKSLNFSNASYLCFSRPIQHILEKSSMNKINYCSPRGDFFLVGPHKLVWMSSRGLLVDPSFSLK